MSIFFAKKTNPLHMFIVVLSSY